MFILLRFLTRCEKLKCLLCANIDKIQLKFKVIQFLQVLLGSIQIYVC